MIVKNEEANLAACVGPVVGLFDEIVVVDTGSTDGTRDIARQFGARVFEWAWVDSFAAARNESIGHATGDWIFWLDADDRIDAANCAELGALLAGLKAENAAYVMKCICVPDAPGEAATEVDHVRLFPNHPALRFSYRVHEQIIPALRRLGSDLRWSQVAIHHVGYQDRAVRLRKLRRDLRLLHLEDDEHPGDPFTLFNLGSVYQELRQPAEALPFLQRSLERSEPRDSIVRKLYALIVQCQRKLGRKDEALATCRAGRVHYPSDTELLFLEGQLLRESGDAAGAELCWLRLLVSREEAHFGSVDAGLAGYKTRNQLALLYQEQGQKHLAEAQWRLAVAERPDFLPARFRLAENAIFTKEG
jgi:tetratricopeptide (TPR) repeat protein